MEQPKVLCATQDGVVRISGATPLEYVGLMTEGLGTCVGLIISGEKDREPRISLSHIDAQVNLEAIQPEIDFVGNISKVFLILGAGTKKNRADSQQLAKKISEKYKDIFEGKLSEKAARDDDDTSKNGENVVVNRNNEITRFEKSNFAKICMENKEYRHAINMLNHTLWNEGGNLGLDVQYDGQKFTPLIDLSDSLQNTIQSKLKEGPTLLHNYCEEQVRQAQVELGFEAKYFNRYVEKLENHINDCVEEYKKYKPKTEYNKTSSCTSSYFVSKKESSASAEHESSDSCRLS